MVDFSEKLKKDLAEQFKGKARIEDLIDSFAAELQEVYHFFEQLRDECTLQTAVGKQLDGVGDIVVMTRKEAGQLAGDPIPFDVIDDETYRRYLIYKILKNTCNCTYPDIIKAFRMFWDYPLYYSEDPDEPATMIFDTGELDETVDASPLLTTPLIRAAGVTLRLIVNTQLTMPPVRMFLGAGLGFAATDTYLPNLEKELSFESAVFAGGAYYTVTEDLLPALEKEVSFDSSVYAGGAHYSVTEDALPSLEREVAFNSKVFIGTDCQSITEDTLPGN